MAPPAPCRTETKRYRACLREKRASGRGCDHLAKTLEACRKQWRKKHRVASTFDGVRVLPNQKCRPLNDAVQHCLQWKQGHQEKCRKEIDALAACMATTKGVVAKPTKTDKIWEAEGR